MGPGFPGAVATEIDGGLPVGKEGIKTMNVHVQSLHYPLTESLRGHIEARIQWALRWFARRAGLVRVVLKEHGGSKGAADQHCAVTVHVKGEGDIRVEGVAGDAYRAISSFPD